MTTALQAKPETEVGLFNYPECTFTATGLIIPEGMAFARWEALGTDLRKAAKGVQFWIGDWIRYGQYSYGEKYAQAIEATGKDEQTLMNYVYVAENVEISRRREKVPFTHHAEVASLKPDQQEKVLEQTENENLTVKEVRRLATRIKRHEGREVSELDTLHSKEVQKYLKDYLEILKQLEEEVPLTAKFLRNMAQAHQAQVFWQMNRTIVEDCDVIMRAVKENSGSASIDEIFNWLHDRGFYMSDPELDERLEYMCVEERRLLSKTDAGEGKQENRRGKLPEIYTTWFKKWHLREPDDDEDVA